MCLGEFRDFSVQSTCAPGASVRAQLDALVCSSQLDCGSSFCTPTRPAQGTAPWRALVAHSFSTLFATGPLARHGAVKSASCPASSPG